MLDSSTAPTTAPQGAQIGNVLLPPPNLAVSGSNREANLRWDAVPGATGYVVTRIDGTHGAITLTPSPIGATSLQDTSGPFHFRLPITYRVISAYPGGVSGLASEVTYAAPPPAPTNARVTQVTNPNAVAGAHSGLDYLGNWSLSWDATPGASRIVIKRRRWQMQCAGLAPQCQQVPVEDFGEVDGATTSTLWANSPGPVEFYVAAKYQPGDFTSPFVRCTAQ